MKKYNDFELDYIILCIIALQFTMIKKKKYSSNNNLISNICTDN